MQATSTTAVRSSNTQRSGQVRALDCFPVPPLWSRLTLIEKYPNVMQVLCTSYTAKTRVLPVDSLFDAIQKHDVGLLGIKPFASNAIFKIDGSPEGPHVADDDGKARLAIRYILCNPAITAPIPGLISTHQVDNMAAAVKEHRQFGAEELADLDRLGDDMWANLPADYQGLKEWEYV